MNWMAATCWALLLAAAFLCDSSEAKGGRGGSRGSARGGTRRGSRGGSRGASRVHVRPASHYTGSSLRVAAAGAAAGAVAGAAAGLATGSGWRRVQGPWERGLEDEDMAPGSNGTGPGVYSYWAWTSDAGPTCGPCFCLLLGGTLGTLGLLQH